MKGIIGPFLFNRQQRWGLLLPNDDCIIMFTSLALAQAALTAWEQSQ